MSYACPICGATVYRVSQICPALGIDKNDAVCMDCCYKCRYRRPNRDAYYCGFRDAPEAKEIYELKDAAERIRDYITIRSSMAARLRREGKTSGAEVIERRIAEVKEEKRILEEKYEVAKNEYNERVKREGVKLYDDNRTE